MISKRIINFGGENRIMEFDKYEFDLNIISTKESIDNYQDKTVIIVEKEIDADKVIDSIEKSINYGGLITTTIADMHEIFYNTGVWKFKHIIKNTTEEIINELLKIETDKMFISILASEDKSIYDYTDIIEKIRKDEKQYIYFSLPVDTNNLENIEVSVLYK